MVVALLAALLGMGAGAAAPGTIVDYPAMRSAYVGSVHVTVWLPPGYEQGTQRYAVLYMQDGQNLFDGARRRSTAPDGSVWGVDTVIAEHAADLRPVIVVAVDHMGVERARQYVPRAVFDLLPQADRDLLAKEYGGVPFSDDYLRFLVKELKPFVDGAYRTMPDRDGRFIMGSSMGALIALYALTEYPDVFGAAACLSTHWPLAVPGAAPVDAADVQQAFEAYLRERLPRNHRLWFDHGDQGLDATYAPHQRRVDALLPSLGWQKGKRFQSVVYVNASHNENAWRARLIDPLTYLLGQHRENAKASK